MPTPTEVQTSPRAAYRYAARHWLAVLLIVLACIALVPVVRALSPSSFVSGVQIQNPSEYAVEVHVAPPGNGGWMPLGTVQPKSTTRFSEVYDQGGTWVVTFSYGPYQTSTTIPRSALQNAGWSVTVPPTLITQLQNAHVPTTPTTTG